MAVKEAKHKKRAGLLRWAGRLAVVFAMAYLVVVFVSGQMEVAAIQRDLDTVTLRVETRTEENAELQRILDSGDEAAYIEKMARELGYARADERVYVDISGQ